jgi:hypothetical protein
VLLLRKVEHQLCVFNVLWQEGGGVFADKAALYLLDSASVSGNTAQHGGGVAIVREGSLTSRGGRIVGNMATSALVLGAEAGCAGHRASDDDASHDALGGGVYARNSRVVLQATTLVAANRAKMQTWRAATLDVAAAAPSSNVAACRSYAHGAQLDAAATAEGCSFEARCALGTATVVMDISRLRAGNKVAAALPPPLRFPSLSFSLS